MKKAAPKKRVTKKILMNRLKRAGLKLPHGYEIRARRKK